MKSLFSFLLLLAAIALAAQAFSLYQEATAGVSFLGIDLSIADQEAKQMALYYGGGALACLLGAFGLYRSR